MSDELDSLSDSEIDHLFAVEVAGLVFKPRSSGTDGCVIHQHWENENGKWMDDWETLFSTDANAVLPWLEKKHGDADITFTKHCGKHNYVVSVRREWVTDRTVAPTLARCLCIALIRAKRATK